MIVTSKEQPDTSPPVWTWNSKALIKDRGYFLGFVGWLWKKISGEVAEFFETPYLIKDVRF